jgi:hypothetical protein
MPGKGTTMTAENQRCLGFAAGVALLLAPLALGQTGDPPAVPEAGRTFTLHEVSVFDSRERPPESLFGQIIVCREAPDANVLAYPAFQSDHPLHAQAPFPAPGEGRDKIIIYQLALDESGGTGRGYDRLYFDLNHDGDLTNDRIRVSREDPMKASAQRRSSQTSVCFETVAVPLPFGLQDSRPVELLPRLVLWTNGPKFVGLLATKARQGVVQIGDRNSLVWLSHGVTVVGWFDHPQTTLYLAPVEKNLQPRSWNGAWLMATQKIDGTFYRFSATPAGDKLTVHPYTGPLGTLQARLAGKTVQRILVTGSLLAPTTTVPVAISISGGDFSDPGGFCKLPVGDYRINYLDAQFDGLSFIVGASRGPDDESKAEYGIAIRADRPFVLDFAGKPQVRFTAPPQERRIKPGQEVLIQALLVDPSLGILFRRIGREGVIWDPQVTITRAGGEIVARGEMPFG